MQGYAKHITRLMLSTFFLLLFGEYISKTKTKKRKKKASVYIRKPCKEIG